MNAWIANLPGPRLKRVVEEKSDALMKRHHTDDVYFAVWLQALDQAVRRRIILSYDDLEDWGYWDAYDADMTPRDAAIEMLYDNGYADWLDLQVLRVRRGALMITETQFLVCRNCGEAFDSITFAHEHGTADLSGSAGWCGDEGFNIVPESEAF